jgi:dynein heavy chain 1
LIEFVIGKDAVSEDVINLNFVVEQETTSKTPILLCSAPGFDPSYKIEYLSKELNVKLVSVAIGSAEGYG